MRRRSPTDGPVRVIGAVVLTLTVWLGLLAPAARAQPPVAAADAFVDSVGVNIHLHYDHTPYKEQFPLIKARLLELGVRHVRDGLIDTTWQGYYDRHNELGEAGITGTFITAFEQSVALLASYPARVSRSFAAYEAPNEPDKSGDPQWVAKLHRMMERLGQLASIPSVAHFPVIGPSLTHESSYAEVGDVSPHFTFANMHNYLAGRHPGTPGWGGDGYGSIEWNLRTIRPYAGGKPIITTEIGYQDGPDVEDSVPLDVSGRYLPRVLLEQYRHGIPRTFIYELIDFPHSGSYGLLHADGSPKPAFHAVKGLLGLLADPGPPFAPQPLPYALVGGGDGVRHQAFQKRDGTYFIAVWLEEPSFDMTARRQTTVLTRAVTLTLPRPMRVARAHHWQADGTVVAVPRGTVSAAVPFDMTDRLTVFELADADTQIGRPGPPGPLIPGVSGRDVILRWQPPATGGAPQAYHLEAAADPSFAAPLTLPLAAGATELAVPGAPPGTYFVRVRAHNAAGTSEWSPAVPVMVGLPGAPTLVPERVAANPIALSWLHGAGGPPDAYVVSAGSRPGASDVALLPLGQSTRLVVTVSPGVQYFVRVAAVGAHGATRSNEVSFRVGTGAAPPPPTLQPPRVSGTTVSLSWTTVSGADGYVVVARAAPGGAVLATLTVSGAALSVPDVPRGTYFVSVVAQREGLVGNESNIVRVDIP